MTESYILWLFCVRLSQAWIFAIFSCQVGEGGVMKEMFRTKLDKLQSLKSLILALR